MFISCWSVKGGSGTSVFTAALGLAIAKQAERAVLLADLAGDLPAVLGLPEPGDPGLTDWLAVGASVPSDGLARLELPVAPRLTLLPRGAGPLGPFDRLEVLASVFADEPRPVLADCGLVGSADRGAGASGLAAMATHSLLVIRPCYLALRRAADLPVRPSGVVLVREQGRVLGLADVEQVIGAPVVAEVAVDTAVSRVVDAGLLSSRFPRSLARSLSPLVATLERSPALTR